MTTDPRGTWFVSYKRESSADVRQLVHALHDRGIPTWIDTSNLAFEPAHDALREAIRDERTAGAILFATDSIRSSETIKLVEAPEILRRRRLDATFGVVPVISGGLDYGTVNSAYGESVADYDLSLWNIYKAQGCDFSEADAVAVSQRVLESRISALHAHLPKHDPIEIGLHTRERPDASFSRGLTIDWSHHFDPRHCSSERWSSCLLPALADVATAVRRFAPGRSVVADGLLGIPAAFALGSSFCTPRGVPVHWRQISADSPMELWSLDASSVELTMRLSVESRTLSAKDIAVLVSITADVRKDFARVANTLPPIRCILDAGLEPLSRKIDARQAATMARAISDALRDARTTHGAVGAVHLFYCGPVGLALMLGQLFNTISQIVTYEYVAINDPPYTPAATIVNI